MSPLCPAVPESIAMHFSNQESAIMTVFSLVWLDHGVRGVNARVLVAVDQSNGPEKSSNKKPMEAKTAQLYGRQDVAGKAT